MQKSGLDNSDRDSLPAGMSCVPPALLIHEQSGEHGVALAWVRSAQPPPPVIPLLPCSHVMPPTCTPTFLLMPDARSETQDAVFATAIHLQIGGRCKLMMLGIRLHDVSSPLAWDTRVTPG